MKRGENQQEYVKQKIGMSALTQTLPTAQIIKGKNIIEKEKKEC
jgi:hypothetical protein